MNDLLQQIMDEVEREFGCSGLAGSTLYGEFAIEVAKRAMAAEREACAKTCDEIAFKHQKDNGTYAAGKKAGAFECAEALRRERTTNQNKGGLRNCRQMVRD